MDDIQTSFSYKVDLLDSRTYYTTTTNGRMASNYNGEFYFYFFIYIYLNVNICFFTYHYLQMFLRISNLTTIWKKSLRRYVSVYTFMSYGLMSKTIIIIMFFL